MILQSDLLPVNHHGPAGRGTGMVKEIMWGWQWTRAKSGQDDDTYEKGRGLSPRERQRMRRQQDPHDSITLDRLLSTSAVAPSLEWWAGGK